MSLSEIINYSSLGVLAICAVIFILVKKKQHAAVCPSRFDYPYLSQLLGVSEEEIRDLHMRIKKTGIPESFVLLGITPYCEECFNLLKREDGKWEVFYGEHGHKSNPLVFDTFEEAGNDLISRI